MSQLASSIPINLDRPIRMTRGALQKRSMRIAGHRTSIALEPEFWQALEKIARAREASLPALIAAIDAARATKRRRPRSPRRCGFMCCSTGSSRLRQRRHQPADFSALVRVGENGRDKRHVFGDARGRL